MNADKPAAVNVSAGRKLPTSFAAGLLGLFFFVDGSRKAMNVGGLQQDLVVSVPPWRCK